MKAPWRLLVLAIILAVLWCLRRSEPVPVDASHPARAAKVVKASSSPSTALPLGDRLLVHYGRPDRPPEQDLTDLAQLMENFLLLVKGQGNRPLSANEDWADALRGRNLARERFLSAEHPAFNDRGQFVDRWGTPLFFHAVGAGRFDLRSAGPDRRMWTADDLHRSSDGTSRRGAELNPSSLYVPTPSR